MPKTLLTAGLVCDICTSEGHRQWKSNVLSLDSVCSHFSQTEKWQTYGDFFFPSTNLPCDIMLDVGELRRISI